MSLTISEANAFCWLLERLTGVPSRPDYGRHVDDERLIDAARLLASKANKVLMAGYDARTAEAAVRAWLDRTATPPQWVATWQQHAAEGIANALDSYDLVIDGEEWYSERRVRDDQDDPTELVLDADTGRSVRVRVTVEVIEGTLT